MVVLLAGDYLGVKRTRIIGGSFTNSGNYGIVIDPDSNNTTIIGATVSGSVDRGIAVDSADNLIIMGCNIINNGLAGIDLVATTAQTNNIIVNNNLNGNGGGGALTINANYTVIHYNNIGSTIGVDSTTATVSNKTISTNNNTLTGVDQNPIIKKTGSYVPVSPTTASTTTIGVLDGILSQHVPTAAGTASSTFNTTEGMLANFATTTTANQNAGLVSPTGSFGVGRRLFGMKAILRSKLDTVASSVSRLYFGFTTNATLPLTDTPIANADHGVIVGFNSTDTNYQIRTNDGSGAATVTAVTGPIAKDANFHTIQIEWAAAGNIIVTFDGVAQTVSTDLPATTADLKFHCSAQNATGAIRTHSIKGVWLEVDK